MISILSRARLTSVAISAAISWTLIAAGCGDDRVGPDDPELVLTSVSPDPLLEGGQALLDGGGFVVQGAPVTVFVDGVPASIVSSTDTRIEITVPTFACRPLGRASVEVRRGAERRAIEAIVDPQRSPLELDVANFEVIREPDQFCFELAPVSGPREYVVGLSLPAELPERLESFVFTAQSPQGSPAAAPVRSSPIDQPRPGPWQSVGADVRLHGARWGAVRHAPRSAISRERTSRSQLRLMPATGDTITMRVPDGDTDIELCEAFFDITGEVLFASPQAIVVVDLENPAGAVTPETGTVIGTQLETDIMPIVTQYIGTPTDLDGNGVVTILMTHRVNRMFGGSGVLGFVSPSDVLDSAACPASNVGEVFYSAIPDDAGAIGTPIPTEPFLTRLPTLLTHEITHVIQVGRRLVEAGGILNTIWELEGQANLSEELFGHRVFGRINPVDLTAEDAFDGEAINFHRRPFWRLGHYFGGVNNPPGVSRVNAAPETCTIFGSIFPPLSPREPCLLTTYFYGVSWSLQRFVVDRFGDGYPGGAEQLTQDWLTANPDLTGSANVAALLGIDWDQLFVEWAMMLWADGRLPGAPPEISMRTWDLENVMSGLGPIEGGSANSFALVPTPAGYGDFVAPGSVRGGSTAYFRLEGSGALPAVGLHFGSPTGQSLTDDGRPSMWILRMR